MSNPESTLCDARRISTALDAAALVGQPPIAHQSLEAALEEEPTPVPRADVEYTFYEITDRSLSAELAA